MSELGMMNFFGFETGDLTGAASSLGGVSTSTTVAKTGTYSLKITGTGANQNWIKTQGTNVYTGTSNVSFDTDGFAVTCWLYLSTLPSTGEEEIMRLVDTASVKMATLRVTSGGAIKVLDSMDAVVGTSSALSTSAWHRLEWLVRFDDVTLLRLNGSDSVTGTGTFHGVNPYSANYLGNFASAGTTAFTIYYDDVAYTAELLLGEAHVKVLIPNANGSSSSWTNDYTSVDEIPHDSATTIISSTAAGNTEAVSMQNSSTAGLPVQATIAAIKYAVVVRRFAIGSPLMVFYSISDGLDDLKPGDTGFSPAVVFTGRWKMTETHQGQLVNQIDDLEVVVSDVRTSGTNALQCTQMMCEVLYLERVVPAQFETPHAGI